MPSSVARITSSQNESRRQSSIPFLYDFTKLSRAEAFFFRLGVASEAAVSCRFLHYRPWRLASSFSAQLLASRLFGAVRYSTLPHKTD